MKTKKEMRRERKEHKIKIKQAFKNRSGRSMSAEELFKIIDEE